MNLYPPLLPQKYRVEETECVLLEGEIEIWNPRLKGAGLGLERKVLPGW
jgi:hypothetical protein